MKPLIAGALVVASIIAFITETLDSSANGRNTPAASAEAITVQVGDIVRVEGGVLGCVARRRAGERFLDCRRAGRLAGTYGTMFGERTVRVVRFRSNSVARIVLSARHGRRATCCR